MHSLFFIRLRVHPKVNRSIETFRPFICHLQWNFLLFPFPLSFISNSIFKCTERQTLDIECPCHLLWNCDVAECITLLFKLHEQKVTLGTFTWSNCKCKLNYFAPSLSPSLAWLIKPFISYDKQEPSHSINSCIVPGHGATRVTEWIWSIILLQNEENESTRPIYPSSGPYLCHSFILSFSFTPIDHLCVICNVQCHMFSVIDWIKWIWRVKGAPAPKEKERITGAYETHGKVSVDHMTWGDSCDTKQS